ncbi:MAG: hypothetical protein ABSE69_07050 [Roseiarcus sp.]
MTKAIFLLAGVAGLLALASTAEARRLSCRTYLAQCLYEAELHPDLRNDCEEASRIAERTGKWPAGKRSYCVPGRAPNH